MAISESWHVRSRSRECAALQRPFVDGEKIITALFPDPESSGYLRKDFCEEGWKGRQNTEENPFSFWKTSFAAPTGNETANPVEKLSAEEILVRLVEEDEDHTENTRYILAVMLERQKLLRETDSQRTPTGILRVYEHRKTGEVFIVKDPDIPLSQVEAVQNEVIILLENNGRAPEADVEEIPAPAPEETQTLESEPPTTDTDADAILSGEEMSATEALDPQEADEGPQDLIADDESSDELERDR